ncbi:Rrf2 family transcriptional regulator [Phaeobacter sp. J2-8]|uniref:Rrf2 family transcriptional regulator n=1 Tax=Phaeobacter sp. J2-8 TaxID=2931394 RepID=UPI001FD5824E|nr:Rrf2 family transcriptional regulator [Phaeobacter sp. J2-8]MCJ7874009.1 Rrf2 family transcriptional regulator [Phaeobacter sp. J2-8]
MNRDTRMSDVLHVLLHLDQVDVPVTSERLAQSMGTNPAVFRRTMAGLRNAGYVQSGRGHGGGWSLARPLAEITLLDVYDALGRPTLFAIGMRSDNPDCLVERNVNLALKDTMAQSEALFISSFGAITLDTLLPKLLRPRSADCVTNQPD